jgi:hypothetical protein
MACWFGSAHVTCTWHCVITSLLPHEAVYCVPQNSEALTPWCQRCAAVGGPCYHKGPSTPHDTLSRKGALCRSLQALSFSSGRDPHGESLICGGQPNCRKDLLIMDYRNISPVTAVGSRAPASPLSRVGPKTHIKRLSSVLRKMHLCGALQALVAGGISFDSQSNAFKPTLPSTLPWPITTTGITLAGELSK